jgi:hypothetical protein
MAIEIKNTQGKVIFTLCANDLSGADLSGADLRSADLSGAKLIGAKLIGADLRSADLNSADLGYADLSGANLRYADLIGAKLSGADLSSANVLSVAASNATNDYDIFATNTHLKIGCQFHPWGDWMGFDDEAIIKMDGDEALKFWSVWKPILRAIAKDRGWL